MSGAAKKLSPAQEAEVAAGWNKRVLVVDDEIELGKIYEEILAPQAPAAKIQSSRGGAKVTEFPKDADRFNFQVTVVDSYARALEEVKLLSAQGVSFALGFFDVRLGGREDGIELFREISNYMPEMYGVFVTAYNDRTIDAITATLGPARVDRWDYMNKPFNTAEITQKARNFVALWNLKHQSEQHASLMSDLNRKVLESERVTSVAAVARGVAHEFGNLLMQIMGKAEISRNKSEEEMRAALNKIVDATQRAHEILDRFNNLSDTKSKSTFKTKVHVEQVVTEAIDLLSHQFKRQMTKIIFEKKDPVEAVIHSTSILQVLVNLFINAIHAMGESGKIEASVVTKGSDRFQIIVRDHGPGVPPELLDKVLEPFFTTKGDKGTGLGLAISREIVEIDHGGEFSLRNHPEGGLEITMEIPVKPEVVYEKV